MLNVKKGLLFALALSSVFPLYVKANSPALAVECQSCATPEQFANAAKSQAALNSWRIVNVMNYFNNRIYKFKIMKYRVETCDSEGEPDGRGGVQEYCRYTNSYYTHPQNISSQEYADFSSAARVVKDIYQRAEKVSAIEIPEEVAGSSWQLLQASYLRTNSLEHARKNPENLEFFDHVSNALGAMSSLGLPVKMPMLEFKFPDDSRAFATADFMTSNGQVHYKFVLMIDKSGNEVSFDKPAKAWQRYKFSPGTSMVTYNAFLSYIGAAGLTVYKHGSYASVPSGSVVVSICTSGKVCPSPN